MARKRATSWLLATASNSASTKSDGHSSQRESSFRGIMILDRSCSRYSDSGRLVSGSWRKLEDRSKAKSGAASFEIDVAIYVLKL